MLEIKVRASLLFPVKGDNIALGGLVVSVLATGPTGYSVAGSNPTEDGGFVRVTGSKAVGPMS
jgi:hypothetical protein